MQPLASGIGVACGTECSSGPELKPSLDLRFQVPRESLNASQVAAGLASIKGYRLNLYSLLAPEQVLLPGAQQRRNSMAPVRSRPMQTAFELPLRPPPLRGRRAGTDPNQWLLAKAAQVTVL